MKILFLTLECAKPYFSGNGTFVNSILANLALDPNVELFVVSGRPENVPQSFPFEEKWLKLDNNTREGIYKRVIGRTICVPVEKWQRLDKTGPWQEYAEGIKQLKDEISKFTPDLAVGVDWHSLLAYESLFGTAGDRIPFTYMNFRVFFASTNATPEDYEFYKQLEVRCATVAQTTIVLSSADAKYFKEAANVTCSVLNPTLPDHVMQFFESRSVSEDVQEERTYLTCCMRQAPEKRVELFVDLVERCKDLLTSLNITPFVCGALAHPEYALSVHQRLKNVYPNCVIEKMLDPAQLRTIFKKTLLNVHPAYYEAYGLTIGEACVFGAPSILDKDAIIGITDKLNTDDAIILIDFEDKGSFVRMLEPLLRDRKKLAEMADKGKKTLLDYRIENYVREFLSILRSEK
jgi:hypothetical protein